MKVDNVFPDGRVSVTETIPGHLDNFKSGDKVLLIQMTGVTLENEEGFLTKEQRIKKQKQNTGRYEVLQVDEVVTGPTTYVVFTDNLSNQYNVGEKIQLVRFVEGETVTVSEPVTARAWDGQVGGVVAILGADSVKLNSNINVSYQGFRGGAMPAQNYNGVCRNDGSGAIKDTLYFLPAETGRSGYKGEGVVNASWPYTMGTAFNYSGGGAGNGRYSGGGGGSNYNEGGNGGDQSAFCTGLSVSGGWRGEGCFELYLDSAKIVMGGGGGSGTRMASATPSPGGNGGGIAIIITGTLVGNGGSILANGQSAASTTGSGGGGGAGGTVLIDADSYSGSPIPVQIRGGNGGSTTGTGENCTGSGGGGSGGIIWHAGTTMPAVIDSAAGLRGTVTCFEQSGENGNHGVRLKNLMLPLNGFLFNTLRGKDTICAGQIPGLITGSQPKGGDGQYTSVWEQSTDNITWIPASGGTNISLLSFQPPALTQTTWYRRVVTSDTIVDVSRGLQIYVYPAISNNMITGEDTICYNSDAQPLHGIVPAPSGGNGSYVYRWEESTNQVTWNVAGTGVNFDPGRLTDTTFYRRVVNSTAWCRDTSNTWTILVLPGIENNRFFAEKDTSICMNTSPGTLNALPPSGGNGAYSYSWQLKEDQGDWTTIPESNGMNLAVDRLTNTTSYRRIVYSGQNNACIDTTAVVKTIVVKLPIDNNNINSVPVRYTCFNTPVTLNGSQPIHGFETYAYQWEQSTDNLSWLALTATDQHLQSEDLTQKVFFRRVVFSSPGLRECTDTSNVVEVRINPLPQGNVVISNEELCEGENLYVKFNVTGNGPFDVTVNGGSLGNKTVNGISGSYDSVMFNPTVSAQTFVIASIKDDSSCLANPALFVAVNPAILYEVPVANAGIDSAVCSDRYVLAAVKDVAGSTGLWTATGAVFDDASSENSEVIVDAYGPKVFTWTETNWRCTDTDEVEVIFYEPPATPDAGPDQVLDFTYTTTLAALPASAGNGKWSVLSGSAEFDDDAIPNTVVSELSKNTSLKWTVTNGNCDAVADSMNITITPLNILKAFTPNDDEFNPYFKIGAENAEKITLKVFNSAGVLVFESDNYDFGDDNRWYGKNSNGVELPEGTYFYIANIKVAGRQQEVQFRSFVEIIR
ncbi:MAG: gliding motility-associated C-terminal domain-containing protein [Bacteroidales bacterium]